MVKKVNPPTQTVWGNHSGVCCGVAAREPFSRVPSRTVQARSVR